MNQRVLKPRRPWLSWGLLFVLTSAGIFLIGLSPLAPKPFSDGYFHSEAKALALALKEGDAHSLIPIVHSPLTPLYYLPAYLLIPRGSPDRAYWVAGTAWNAVWLCLAFFLMGMTSEHFGDRSAGMLCMFCAAVTFFPLYYSAGIASETPAYLFCAGIYYYLQKITSDKPDQDSVALRSAIASGALIGLLVSVRGNYVLTLPLVALAGAFLWPTKWKQFTIVLLSGSAVVVLLYGGVRIFNLSINSGRTQDSFLTHVLVQGAFQYRSEPWDWRGWEKESRGGSCDYAAYQAQRKKLTEIRDQSGMALTSVEWQWLHESWRTEPEIWLQMAPVKMISAQFFRISPTRVAKRLGGGTAGTVAARLLETAANLPFLALTALGAAFLWNASAKRKSGFMLVLPFLAGLIFVGMTYSEPRYLVPAHGGITILGSLMLHRILCRDASFHSA